MAWYFTQFGVMCGLAVVGRGISGVGLLGLLVFGGGWLCGCSYVGVPRAARCMGVCCRVVARAVGGCLGSGG